MLSGILSLTQNSHLMLEYIEFRCVDALIASKRLNPLYSNKLHKPGVLDLIPGDCWPFHFPLLSRHNIYNLFTQSSKLATGDVWLNIQRNGTFERKW